MRRHLPLLAATLAIALTFAGRACADGLLIVAHPAVTVASPLTASQVAAIYLLRTPSWPDGHAIVPVNREAASAIRRQFTAVVLQQDNASLALYWNQMHFAGKSPPVVQESEQAVLAFVRRVPGALGYIDAATPPVGVSVIGRIP